MSTLDRVPCYCRFFRSFRDSWLLYKENNLLLIKKSSASCCPDCLRSLRVGFVPHPGINCATLSFWLQEEAIADSLYHSPQLQEQIHRIDGQNIPVARADARPSDSPADSPSFDRRQSLRSSLEGLPSPGANLARLSADQIYNMDPASAFRLGRAHELALRRSQGLALAAQDPAFLGADPGLRPPPLQESPFRGSPEAGGRVRMLDERARMDLLRSSYDGALPHQALEGSFRPSADPVFRGNDRLRGQELGPIGFRSAENALRHSWEGSLRMPPGGGNGGAAGASAGAGSPSPSSLRDRESVNGAREEANAGIRSLDLGSRQGSGNTLEAAGYREGSVGYRDGGGMSPYRESGNGITGNGQQYYAGMEGMAGERLRVGSIDRYGNPVLLDSPGVRSSGDLSAVYSRDVEMRQPLDSPQVSPYDPMDVATSYERSRGAISRLSPALERLHTPPLDYPPGLSNPAALAALSPALREGLRSSRLEPQLLLAEQLTDPDWPIPRGGRGGSAERQYAEGSGSSDGKGHRIFVGGVPDQITEAQMKAHFERLVSEPIACCVCFFPAS